jgi:hypothetical protein
MTIHAVRKDFAEIHEQETGPEAMEGELSQLAKSRTQLLTAMRAVEARGVVLWMNEHPSAFDGWPSCALYDSEAHGVFLRAVRGRLPNWLQRSVSDHRLWSTIAGHIGTLRSGRRRSYFRRVVESEGGPETLRIHGSLT